MRLTRFCRDSQAGAWRRVVPVGAVLPPYPSTRDIPWSSSAGQGAVFAGRLSPEKGAAEAIDIARAAGVPIDVYGDTYDAGYSREQIGPRRAWPGVAVHAAVPRASLWPVMARAAVVLCPARWDEPFGMVAAEAAASLKLTATDLLELGLIDGIVPEPGEGAHTDPDQAAEAVRATLRASLAELSSLSAQRLMDDRYLKFRRMGAFFTEASV